MANQNNYATLVLLALLLLLAIVTFAAVITILAHALGLIR